MSLLLSEFMTATFVKYFLGADTHIGQLCILNCGIRHPKLCVFKLCLNAEDLVHGLHYLLGILAYNEEKIMRWRKV